MWLLAATARPLQPLTRDCDEDRMSGLVSISHLHRKVTACRCELSFLAKAACRAPRISWRVVEYDA